MSNVMVGAVRGGLEIVIILLVLLMMGALFFGVVFLAAWRILRPKPPATKPPTPALSQKEPTESAVCPRCGSRLPVDSPQGLCPRCVLGVGLSTQTETTGGGASQSTRIVPPPMEEVASRFPHLEILECLGHGGMGVVYKARQPKLNRYVALKILSPEKGADPRFAERFLREAQALARLNHPNIVMVHDFGEADGMFFLLMEYVDGMTLRQLMLEGRMKPEEALAVVPQICEALQFAHEQGVVHRDIKPENVLLDKQGRLKIADFGIAKIVAGAQMPQGITQDQVIGTPHYMAPEQVEKPQTVDHRADIYSLGVVFYEMLTGELPLGKFQPPSRKVSVDVRLDEVVLHALEKEPALRYQKASELKTDLHTIATGQASPAGSQWPQIPVHIKNWRRGSSPEGPAESSSRVRTIAMAAAAILVAALLTSPLLLPGCRQHFIRQTSGANSYDPARVPAVEQKLTQAVKDHLEAGSFRFDSALVNVKSAKYDQAECLITGLERQAGSSIFTPATGTLEVHHVRDGLWSFVGTHDLSGIRFHVNASEEMGLPQIRPPENTFHYAEPEPGSSIYPADATKQPTIEPASQRKFVRLVVNGERITFEGKPATWESLGDLLSEVPDRSNTVLEFAVTSDQITVAQKNDWLQRAAALADKYGYEYASFVGVHPAGSKGTPVAPKPPAAPIPPKP